MLEGPGPAGERRLGPRPRRGQARAGAARARPATRSTAARSSSARRRAVRASRSWSAIAARSGSRSTIADSLRAHRRRRARAPRRRGAVPAPAAELRFRHDVRHLDRLALARQRAALALGLGQRRPAGLVQPRGCALAGDRRADRGDARGPDRARISSPPCGPRPRAAVGLLHRAAVPRRSMDRFRVALVHPIAFRFSA